MVKFKDEIIQGFKKYWWIIVGIIIFNMVSPTTLSSVDIQTQSIFGGLIGFGLSFGLLLFLVGAVLIIIPSPVTTIPGALMLTMGLFLGFGAILDLFNSVSDSLGGTFSIIILVFIGFLIIKKLFKL